MSKHNYSQYSKKKHDEGKSCVKKDDFLIIDDLVETPATKETPEIKMVVETVDTVALPKTITGFVTNCSKLNVRVEPSIDADVVCVLNSATEVEIDLDNSTDEWFSICTAAGIDGYCMRKFINAKL